MVTPRCSADFCNSLKTVSRRVSMNFFPAARAPLVSEALSEACELRLVAVDGRWVCIRRWSSPEVWGVDIPGFTGQYVERPGNLTVAEERIISIRQFGRSLGTPNVRGVLPLALSRIRRWPDLTSCIRALGCLAKRRLVTTVRLPWSWLIYC